MVDLKKHPSDEVEELIRNAELRYELEPYDDDSIAPLEDAGLPLNEENEYLEMMLAWETAPIRPIFEWFNPPLQPKNPATLPDAELSKELWKLIYMLFDKQIVLDFTDHLSDRELYTLICRDILPSREKMLAVRNGYLHWDCAGIDEDQEIWLRYYATEEERECWEIANDKNAPLHLDPPYERDMPTD